MDSFINKLALGTVQFGIPYGINNSLGKPNEKQIDDILLHAYRCGIRLLDTAEIYGTAHYAIGNFHKNYPSNIFEVITKVPSYINFIDLEAKMNNYVQELNISNLSGLLFHSFKSYQENSKFLKHFNRSLTKSLGVSVYSNKELEIVIYDKNINLIQVPFNLLDNFSIKGELLKIAKENGKVIHSRSAFLQGLFFKNVDDTNSVVKSLRPQLIKINEIAEANNLSIEQLALSYCISQKAIDKVLIGVDSLEQLNSNLLSTVSEIPENIIFEINQIKTGNLDLLNPALWY